jgi:two-component system sensor histidine kinase DesK
MKSMLQLLKTIDHWLLPRNLAEPYSPYVWLIYLPLFFVPVIIFQQNTMQLVWTALISVVFLLVYFRSYWANSQQVVWYLVAMIVLGALGASITPTASTLFVYAAAMCCRLKTIKQAYLMLAAVMMTIIALSVIFSYDIYFYLPGLIFSMLTGLTMIYQYALSEKKQELILSRQETQRLAKVAERERIARDLHDLIGHTFSVITLKADLAGRLLDKGMEKGTDSDLKKARTEIKQLETISRDALSQVREVVSGYRSSDLLSELANAKNVFASLAIEFEYQLTEISEAELEADMQANKELAIVLRELVTNIIKHAKATKVSVEVKKRDQGILLFVQDNGQGMASEPGAILGFGLKGIHERITKLQGWVKLGGDTDQLGTLSEIYVPHSH